MLAHIFLYLILPFYFVKFLYLTKPCSFFSLFITRVSTVVCKSIMQHQEFFTIEITLYDLKKLNYFLGHCNKIILVLTIPNHAFI